VHIDGEVNSNGRRSIKQPTPNWLRGDIGRDTRDLEIQRRRNAVEANQSRLLEIGRDRLNITILL
jgi:hypothetical protein